MKDEILDIESYVYIRVLAKMAERFSVGDYVKLSTIEVDENDKLKFVPRKTWISGFKSKIYVEPEFNLEITPIYKVTRAISGYMEGEMVNPYPKGTKLHEEFRPECIDLTGQDLRRELEEFMYDDDDIEEDAEKFINFAADGYLKIDEAYTESIILECEYIPYSDHVDAIDILNKIEKAKELERKEIFRRRAIAGHQTRRKNKLRAEQKALEEAYAKIVAAQKNPHIRVKSVKSTKKVSKVVKPRTAAKKR